METQNPKKAVILVILRQTYKEVKQGIQIAYQQKSKQSSTSEPS